MLLLNRGSCALNSRLKLHKIQQEEGSPGDALLLSDPAEHQWFPMIAYSITAWIWKASSITPCLKYPNLLFGLLKKSVYGRTVFSAYPHMIRKSENQTTIPISFTLSKVIQLFCGLTCLLSISWKRPIDQNPEKLCNKLPLIYETGSQDTPSPRAQGQTRRKETRTTQVIWNDSFLCWYPSWVILIEVSVLPSPQLFSPKETRRGLH